MRLTIEMKALPLVDTLILVETVLEVILGVLNAANLVVFVDKIAVVAR